jgi:hypothetical protein
MSRTQQIASLAAPAIVLLSIIYFAGDRLGLKKEPISAVLEREAAELNATLPEMVSRSVRLDKAAAGPGNAFAYFYTIVDDDVAKRMSGNSVELDKLKAQLKERVCTNMPAYRENGTIVTYSVKSNAGVTIADVSINPKHC